MYLGRFNKTIFTPAQKENLLAGINNFSFLSQGFQGLFLRKLRKSFLIFTQFSR